MTPDAPVPGGTRASGLLSVPGEALALMAEAVLALRSTHDVAVTWGLAQAQVRRALGARESQLLRVDARSGALSRVEASGVETPYLAEPGGPVEAVMRHDRPSFDDGAADPLASREALLWNGPVAALATLPLVTGSVTLGVLLVAFDRPRSFAAPERVFLQAIGDALALAIERAELRRALEDERQRTALSERRLARAHGACTGMVHILARELRSPLASVTAYTETLQTHLDDPATPRRRFLDVIGSECDRLSRIVADVQDLSRIEGGEVMLRLAPFTVAGFVREVVARMQDEAAARGITLEFQGEEASRAEADLELLRRALVNLVHHAMQFTPQGGRVEVVVGAHQDEWTVEVTDSGATLPASDLAAVFDDFDQASHAPEHAAIPAEGARIGLAITRSIVELHGGRLWASRPEGQTVGARLGFALPRHQVASPRARRIARQTVGREDLRRLFDAIVEMVAASMETSLVSLVLVDPERGDLFVASSIGHPLRGIEGRRITMRSGVAGAVAAWGRPVLVEDIETDPRFRRLNHPQYRTKSLLSVPLRVEGEVIGVVNANNKHNGSSFDEDDLALLSMIVERVGSVIERACTVPDSPRVVEDALEAVHCMTQLKREFSLGGRHTMKRARAVARELGLSNADVDIVGYCASIHDIGMVRFESETGHTGGLDPTQRNAVASHPEVSVEILRPLEYQGVVRETIMGHHERWDGSGYPRGLSHESIPVGSRILAVVDTWESMTSARPYRAPLDDADAVRELQQQSGRQFDPHVVEAFLRVLAREHGARPAA